MNAFYSPLDNEALLHIQGPDALTFLQGQTTADTRNVDAGHALPGVYCTPKGRVVCDFLLCQVGEEHLALRMRRDILEAATTTFSRYIVFSKAEITSDTSSLNCCALWGNDAAALLADTLGARPQSRYEAASGEGYTVVQVDDAGLQFECFLNPACLDKLAQKGVAGSASDWASQQIRAGIGRIEAATSELFIPQMLNYDLTGHISFTKGCYTGQEVVARLHYLGKPKRRLYLATLESDVGVEAGAALFTSGQSQSSGTVVNAARDARGQQWLLVTATVGGVEGGLQLNDADGPTLSMAELPYPLDESTDDA